MKCSRPIRSRNVCWIDVRRQPNIQQQLGSREASVEVPTGHAQANPLRPQGALQQIDEMATV